jgi:hypothetical protein
MVIRTLGSVGLGLVWGWLSGGLVYRNITFVRVVFAIILSTATLALLVLYFLKLRGLALFVGAMAFASLVHGGLRQQLAARFFSQHTLKEKRQ